MLFTRKNPPRGYYVYLYLRLDGTPYYVGKGKGKRAWVNHRVFNKKTKMWTGIHTPSDPNKIIIFMDDLTELWSLGWERKLISWFGRKDIETGILRNKTGGGDGSGEDSHETRKKKARPGKLNGMFGKTHSDKTKIKLATSCIDRFKGKSYEELYGKEKSDELKQIRSKNAKNKDNSGSKNPRFDNNIYIFYNVETQEIFKSTRYKFYSTFGINKGGVCHMISRGIAYNKWMVIQ